MLPSPYLTTLKLCVFQARYTSEEEIAHTIGKLNADQREKHLANNFIIGLLTFSVKFWMTQRV